MIRSMFTIVTGLHCHRNWILFHRPHYTLQWHHNGHNGVSNHQPQHCLLNRLLMRRSKKTSNSASLSFAENSPVTGEFTAQRVNNAENDSIWWRRHDTPLIMAEVALFSRKNNFKCTNILPVINVEFFLLPIHSLKPSDAIDDAI